MDSSITIRSLAAILGLRRMSESRSHGRYSICLLGSAVKPASGIGATGTSVPAATRNATMVISPPSLLVETASTGASPPCFLLKTAYSCKYALIGAGGIISASKTRGSSSPRFPSSNVGTNSGVEPESGASRTPARRLLRSRTSVSGVYPSILRKNVDNRGRSRVSLPGVQT